MIDDRDYILFKLLCRLADKSSQRKTHGMVYVCANMDSGSTCLDVDAQSNFAYLSDLVRFQLGSTDLIVKLSAATFVIILKSTSEEQTKQLAALIRSRFQHLPMTHFPWNISMGAALFDQSVVAVSDLINTVCNSAFQSRSENRVVYQNLTSAFAVHQPPSANKAA